MLSPSEDQVFAKLCQSAQELFIAFQSDSGKQGAIPV